MRVLFLNPGKDDVCGYDTTYPPLWALAIGAVLRDDGHEVAIEDFDRRPMDAAAVESAMHRHSPDVVGVSALTGPQLGRALLASTVAKSLGATVVWGGPHPTILPEQTLRHPAIDAVVIGEGEIATRNLLRHLEGRRAGVELRNVALKHGETGSIEVFPPHGDGVDLNELPLPAWDLLPDLDRYVTRIGEDLRIGDRWRIKMNTSRSCIYRCSFCFQANDNVRDYLGKYRYTHPERIVREIEFVRSLSRRDVSAFDFVDMLTLFNRRVTREYCEYFLARGLDVKWYASGRQMMLDDEIVHLLARAGCEMLFFGIESGSNRVLRMLDKEIDRTVAAAATRALSKAGIYSIASWVFGFPTETRDEIEETIALMRSIPSSLNCVQVYQPVPGTPLFDESVKRGDFVPPSSLEEWVEVSRNGIGANVSDVDGEWLYRIAYETAVRQYVRYFLAYEVDHLAAGRREAFLDGLTDNRVEAERPNLERAMGFDRWSGAAVKLPGAPFQPSASPLARTIPMSA
jgi:radical SAM superfamily enzyme YgiQ (UPF0313 family)